MKRLIPTTSTLFALVLATATLHAQQPAADTPAAPAATIAPPSTLAPGDSHIRIVRLSALRGAVQLDRNTGSGFEPTMTNMPIVEGSRLKTELGVAEVEFEDGSALRLATDTTVEFPDLILHADGVRSSTINLKKGMAYLSLSSARTNDIALRIGDRTLILEPSTHLRVDYDPARLEVAVFSGAAHFEDPTLPPITKKHTLELSLTTAAPPTLLSKVEDHPFDLWDKQSTDYQKNYSRGNALASSPYQYGTSDLNYYGSFADFGGCGMMWRPYLASSAWDPYGNGVWANYTGVGYSWVSPYPWGWTPFHYGAWNYCPGSGWGWVPGGQWHNLNNVPASSVGQSLKTASGTPIHGPHPPTPPTSGHASLVAANRTPLTFSTLKNGESFVFTKNSAGLGVPRGELGNLNKISRNVEQHGFVTQPVYAVSSIAANPHSNMATPSAGRGEFQGVTTLRPGQPGINSASRSGPSPSGQSPAWSNTVSAPASSAGSFSHGASAPSGGGSTGGTSHK
jgi:hypothetical protein